MTNLWIKIKLQIKVSTLQTPNNSGQILQKLLGPSASGLWNFKNKSMPKLDY